MEARARISGIKQGLVFAPFHYGYFDTEDHDGRPKAANELTITEWDPVSKQPLFKVAAVRVTKIADGEDKPSSAPTTTASAPARGSDGSTPVATSGGAAAEATETLKEG